MRRRRVETPPPRVGSATLSRRGWATPRRHHAGVLCRHRAGAAAGPRQAATVHGFHAAVARWLDLATPPHGLSSGRWSPVPAATATRLAQVYLTLCVALASSAVGAYLHVVWNIGGMLTMLGCVGSIAWLFSVPVYEERKRYGLLMAAALLEGASVGPLIKLAVEFDPSILVTAFVGTAIAFACFSCAAVVAKRREYLYLGGLLSSGLSILLWLQFAASIFGHSTSTFMFEVYFGLLIFLGYMVYDTQEIIERAHHGDMDYIKHALTLFTDFVAVLVRILVIMLKNAADKSEDKKRKKRS